MLLTSRLLLASALCMALLAGGCKSNSGDSAAPNAGEVRVRSLDPGFWEDVYTHSRPLEAYAFEITAGDDAEIWIHYRSPNQHYLHSFLGDWSLPFEEEDGLRTKVRRGQKVVVFVQIGSMDTNLCTRDMPVDEHEEVGLFECHEVTVGFVGSSNSPGYRWMYSFHPAGGARVWGASVEEKGRSVDIAIEQTIPLLRTVHTRSEVDDFTIPATGEFVARSESKEVSLTEWKYSAWEFVMRVEPLP